MQTQRPSRLPGDASQSQAAAIKHRAEAILRESGTALASAAKAMEASQHQMERAHSHINHTRAKVPGRPCSAGAP
jgi:ElaB/YqjD/DUF883 family membrane-anchored ribosome-binding protein